MKKFKYFIFLISLTFLFGVNKVLAANTGSWITDYCTYTLTDDDTYGKVININSCNFSSASDVTNIVVPLFPNSSQYIGGGVCINVKGP